LAVPIRLAVLVFGSLLGLDLGFATEVLQVGNPGTPIADFRRAKKRLVVLHKSSQQTLYCGCTYKGQTVDPKSCGLRSSGKQRNRALRLEWEHVVPAEAFGQSFKEWREGAVICGKKRGRKCAEKNPIFRRMEGDMYNLWPEVGEINALRSNFSMAELSQSEVNFGLCKIKIANRKFEPSDQAKGIVARVYQYMDLAYPGRGIISEKNQKLFEAWDKLYPPNDWECQRAQAIEAVQRNPNIILRNRCDKKKS